MNNNAVTEKNTVQTQSFVKNNAITGEGINLDIQPLGIFWRAFAFGIDFLLYSAVFILLSFTFILFSSHIFVSFKSTVATTLFSIVFSFFILPVSIEYFSKGYSFGKYIIGARVLRLDSSSISFQHVFTRVMFGYFENILTFGAVALITAASNERFMRVGDFLAGTYVAKIPQRILPMPFIMPPELDEWSQSASVFNLPNDLYVKSRDFIYRAHLLKADTRARYANAYAEALKTYVSPLPNFSVHDERFIVAILILHRDKHFKQMLSKVNAKSNFSRI